MKNAAQKVLSSSLIILAIRVFHRSLGLISTLILARLLTPADFGFVAIIAIILQLLEIITLSGAEQYIIQKKKVDNRDLNTAWTLNLIVKIAVWLCFIMLVPSLADFFSDERLTNAMWVASSILLINGLGNPGMFILKREFNYQKIFYMSVVQKTLSFSAVMIMVLISPSYWALIVGDIVSSFVLVAGSHIISNHRVKFSLANVKLQFSFTQWLLYKAIFGFIRGHIDTILVSRSFLIDEVGMYYLTKHITSMPETDIIRPAVEPLLSTFSRARNSEGELERKVRFSIFSVLLLILPMATFLFFFSSSIVNVVLGPQWADSHLIFSLMSISLLSISISHVLEHCFVALNRVRLLFFYDVLTSVLTIIVLFHSTSFDLEYFVSVHVCMVAIATSFKLFLLRWYFPLKIVRLLYIGLLVLFSSCACARNAEVIVNSFLISAIPSLMLSGLIFSIAFVGIYYVANLMGARKLMEFEFATDLILTNCKNILLKLKRRT